jgi:hypothetical protein
MVSLNHPAPLHQENPLAFFNLLSTSPVEHPPHNRQVEAGGPTIRRRL